MALTAEQLIHSLGRVMYSFCGPIHTEIYEAMLWNSLEPPRPGVLYVAATGMSIPGESCVLYVKPTMVDVVTGQLQAVLARDYRRNVALSRLSHAVFTKVPVYDLVSICHEVVENPVCLFDDQLRVTAISGAEELKAFLPAILSHRPTPVGGGPVLIKADDACPCDSILGPVYHEEKLVGYVLVIAWEQQFSGKMTQIYTDHICAVLSARMWLDDLHAEMTEEQRFILELLQRRVTDPEVILRRCKELEFPEHDKYYVLSVKAHEEDDRVYMRNALGTILGVAVYEYSHYYVAVVGCEIQININDQSYPELNAFLQKYDLYAGLSNGILDYSFLSWAFEQSVVSVPLRRHVSQDIRFARYEDMMLCHLLAIANQSGMPFLSFCHPVVMQIERYDQENGTDYLKTLTAYVFNNLSLSEAADALFIHRNTLYHRINTLKELFKIDFDNRRLFMKLQISCTMYSYIGRVKTEKLWGPMV